MSGSEGMAPVDSPGQEMAGTVREVIRRRRSSRSFSDDRLTDADLRDIVESGVWAPSGSNAQNQRFLIITDRTEIRRIGEVRWVHPYPGSTNVRPRQPGGILDRAAALVIVFADAGLSDPRGAGEYHIWERLEVQNCAASIQNMLLLATAKGIGSCWVSWHDSMSYTRLMSGSSWRGLLAAYEIPQTYKIQGVVLLGVPRHRDDRGFPKGELQHGVQWSPVERKPLDHYLVTRSTSPSEERRPGLLDRLRIHVYRAIIGAGVRIIRAADVQIHRVESRLGVVAASPRRAADSDGRPDAGSP